MLVSITASRARRCPTLDICGCARRQATLDSMCAVLPAAALCACAHSSGPLLLCVCTRRYPMASPCSFACWFAQARLSTVLSVFSYCGMCAHTCRQCAPCCMPSCLFVVACGCCYAQAFTSPWPSPGLSLHQEQRRQLKAVAVDLTRTAAGHMDTSGCALGSSAHSCATTCETWVSSITVSTLCASTEQCHSCGKQRQWPCQQGSCPMHQPPRAAATPKVGLLQAVKPHAHPTEPTAAATAYFFTCITECHFWIRTS